MFNLPQNPPPIYCSALNAVELKTITSIRHCLGLGDFVEAEQAEWLFLRRTDSKIIKPPQKIWGECVEHLKDTAGMQNVRLALATNANASTKIEKDFLALGLNIITTSPQRVTLYTKNQQISLQASAAAHQTGSFIWLVVIGLAMAGGLNLTEALVVAGLLLSAALRNTAGILKFQDILPIDFPLACIEENGTHVHQKKTGPSLQQPPFLPLNHLQPQLYPIVDRASWLPRIAPVKIAQLRIKDLKGEPLKQEIQQAIELAKKLQIQLFINDYWELAIKLGAFGVHLGQEDLHTANLCNIREARLRLGISTHCYLEAAICKAINPSYMAFGPIFFTQLKVMQFAPQGIEKLGWWRQLFQLPLVAIGGIQLEHAQKIKNTGVDFIAVVRDILTHPEPEIRVHSWLKCLNTDKKS